MIWFLVFAMAILVGVLVADYTPNTNTKSELMALQATYLADRDDESLGQMWTRLYAMAKGHVRHWMRNCRRTFSEPDVESRAADAANYIIEQYLTRPDFEITDSFDSYLRLRVMAELASPKRQLRDAREIHLESDEMLELPACGDDVLAQTGAYRDALIGELWDHVYRIVIDEYGAEGYRRLIQLWLRGWSRQELRDEAVGLRLDYAKHIEHRKSVREFVAHQACGPPAIPAS